MRFSLGSAALNVRASAWLQVGLNHGDRVESVVQLAVTTAIEPVTLDRAR
jgi:DNA-binding transcriptional regulator YhcF (GntR family)